jgi:hypothetical protein
MTAREARRSERFMCQSSLAWTQQAKPLLDRKNDIPPMVGSAWLASLWAKYESFQGNPSRTSLALRTVTMTAKLAASAILVALGLLSVACGGRTAGSGDDLLNGIGTGDGDAGQDKDKDKDKNNQKPGDDAGPDADNEADAGIDTGLVVHPSCSVVRGGTGEEPPGCGFTVTLIDPPTECGFDSSGNPSSPSICTAMCGLGVTECSSIGPAPATVTCGAPCPGPRGGDPVVGHAGVANDVAR